MSKTSTSSSYSKLTIIIPAFNEESSIGTALDKLIPIADSNNFQIIVVNDGSSDKTQEIVGKRQVNLINHTFNKGYGAALKTGIRAADTPYIATYDSDGQHNPEDLWQLWKSKADYDMLVGKRGKDSYQKWSRKPGKWILLKTANFLTGQKIPDLNSGLRIIKREKLADKMHLFSDSFSFSTTSTVAFMSLGYNVEYFPITVEKRVGKSTVRQLKHGPNTIMIILRMVVLFNPLKVFLPVSLFLFLLGVGWGIYGYYAFSRFPNSAILVTLMGVLFFFMGLISDQISTLNKK